MHITPSLPETGEDFAACALPKRYVELINGGNAPGSSRSTGGLRGGLYARLWPIVSIQDRNRKRSFAPRELDTVMLGWLHPKLQRGEKLKKCLRE